MDKAILVRLQEEIHALGVIPDELHGVRSTHSTMNQRVHVVDYITTGFN